jgi:hypothetical protein
VRRNNGRGLAYSVAFVLVASLSCGAPTPTGGGRPPSSAPSSPEAVVIASGPGHISVSGSNVAAANGSADQLVASCYPYAVNVYFGKSPNSAGTYQYLLQVSVPDSSYSPDVPTHQSYPKDATSIGIPVLLWQGHLDGSADYAWGGGGSGQATGDLPQSASSGTIDTKRSGDRATGDLPIAGKLSMTLGAPDPSLADHLFQGTKLATGSVRVTASWNGCQI